MAHLGVEDHDAALETRLLATYRTTGGSIEALLREIVRSGAFWSESSRWTLIKSPVHLAAGACRQLGISSPPLAEVARWLGASGQTLFDTPNNGEGGWPGQEADRFALLTAADDEFQGRIRIDATRSPGHLDFVHDDGLLWQAIFVAQPDFFRLNYVEADTDTTRPTMFVTTADTPGTVIVMQR